MKWVFILLCTVALCACGKVEVEQQGKFEGVVYHKIDLGDIKFYFEFKCNEEIQNPTPEEITQCVNERMADFLDKVGV